MPLIDFLRRNAARRGPFVLVCFILGLMAGSGAFMLKRLTALISRLATDGVAADTIPWRFLWLPIVGVVLAGILQRYIVRQPLDHGTRRINEALRSRGCRIAPSTILSPIAGASFTLGLGGSAGSEGPIAYASAAMGSNLGRLLGMPPRLMAALVAIGGGAGIAGIFKSPVGGFFFAIEILSVELSGISIVGLAVACITAGMTAFVLSGFTPDVVFSHIPPLEPRLLLWALPLGVVCGLYSIYYSFIGNRIGRFYTTMRHPALKWVASGMSIGLLIFALPSLYGEGYGVIARILDGHGIEALTYGSIIGMIGHMSPLATLLLLSGAAALVKSIASASTNDGGGVAGDFAPTIFAGAVVGFFFAAVATMATHADASLPALVLMAMGGVMAGAVRAPLMAMFIVAEMTGAYSLLLPVALTATLSFLIVKLASLRSARSGS